MSRPGRTARVHVRPTQDRTADDAHRYHDRVCQALPAADSRRRVSRDDLERREPVRHAPAPPQRSPAADPLRIPTQSGEGGRHDPGRRRADGRRSARGREHRHPQRSGGSRRSGPYHYSAYLMEGTDSRGIDVGYLVRPDRADVSQERQLPVPEGLLSRPPLQTHRPAQGYRRSGLRSLCSTTISRPYPAGSRFTRPRRVAQAELNAQAVRDLLTDDPSAPVAVLGDLNSFYDSPPLQALATAGLTDLFDGLGARPTLQLHLPGRGPNAGSHPCLPRTGRLPDRFHRLASGLTVPTPAAR